MTDESPHHDELPLPDYDHLPSGSLEARVRALDAEGVEELLVYERAHGDRLPVVLLLERRLESLRSGEAAPSGGSPLADTPEADPGQPGGSMVTPQTEGPAMNPPSHGDPTNPAQPR